MPPYASVLMACIRLAISFLLLMYAVPVYGIEGAAVSIALTAFLIFIVQSTIVWKHRPLVNA
jgi:Na+-driven multidrug efflux pump